MTHPDASPYQVLGIASDATEEEVRRAYREKAKLLHPDRGGSGSGSDTRTATTSSRLRLGDTTTITTTICGF